ncbi:pyrroline-5-carboxylate reductase [Thermovibrio sp.]
MNLRVGFIGGGNMAEAFIGALVEGEFLLPSQVSVSDLKRERLDFLSKRYGVKTFLTNKDVVLNSDLIFLAVKPQVLTSVLNEIKELITPAQILISMAAGYPIFKLEEVLGDDKKIVRIMPNILVKVRKGAVAYCDNKRLIDEEKELVLELLLKTGKVYEIEESLFDAFTSVAGSSPAFIFLLIEAFCDGGVRLGLPRDKVREIALQVIEGSCLMAKGEHPEVLKDKVSSPAGTTIEGLTALEENAFRFAFIEALKRACDRSREISQLVKEF